MDRTSQKLTEITNMKETQRKKNQHRHTIQTNKDIYSNVIPLQRYAVNSVNSLHYIT